MILFHAFAKEDDRPNAVIVMISTIVSLHLSHTNQTDNLMQVPMSSAGSL